MTRGAIKRAIKEDIEKLSEEQEVIKQSLKPSTAKNPPPQALIYIISRKRTLMEVLKMLQ